MLRYHTGIFHACCLARRGGNVVLATEAQVRRKWSLKGGAIQRLATNLAGCLVRQRKGAAPPSPAEVLASLDDPFRTALVSMYDNEPQLGEDGLLHPLDNDARISPTQGMWVYDLCRQLMPSATLEIGLAYGFSTIFFLAARQKNNLGSHTAIDPLQRFTSGWAGIGLTNGRRFGGEHFQFIEETSATALGRLVDENRRFDVIFIDGSHLFDAVMADFTLSGDLCPVAGHIIFDDMWMPAIQRAVSFVRTNRSDFAEVPTPISNIAVFRRVGADTRHWKHFVEFAGS